VTGCYPEVLTRTEATRRQAWFGSHITTILERDVRDLANVAGLRDLPRLLRLAASRTMDLLNVADLSRDAAMPQTTLQRYWALFEATFLVRPLPPWHANLGLRLGQDAEGSARRHGAAVSPARPGCSAVAGGRLDDRRGTGMFCGDRVDQAGCVE
jgi:hypothetical protein